jgi:hypothetical protein
MHRKFREFRILSLLALISAIQLPSKISFMHLPRYSPLASNNPSNTENTTPEAETGSQPPLVNRQSLRSSSDPRSRSQTLGRPAAPSAIPDPANRSNKAQKQADKNWVYAQIENYWRCAMATNIPRQMLVIRNVLNPFIVKVHRHALFRPLSQESAGISRGDYLVQMRKHLNEGVYHHQESVVKIRLHELHDVLFAVDLLDVFPQYQGFCLQLQTKESLLTGLIRIRNLLNINRFLLDANDSLLARCQGIADATHRSEEEAMALTIELEMEVRRHGGNVQSLHKFIDFCKHGPENFSAPEQLAINMDTSAVAAQASRRPVSMASDDELHKKLFNMDGAPRLLTVPVDLYRDGGESILIRSAGCATGGVPFYHGVNRNADTVSHAIGSFLQSALDFALHPLVVSQQEYQREAEQAALDFQGTELEALPPHDPRFVSAVLLRMEASLKPVTIEALQHVTSHVVARSDPSEDSLATDFARALCYFELIGVPVTGLLLSKSRMHRLDWKFFHAMLEATESAFSRMIIGCKPQREPESQFVVIRRDKINRRSILIDCLRSDQPERRPSRFARDLIKNKRIDTLALILPAAQETRTPAVHSGFFAYYRAVLSQGRFADMVEALSAFVEEPVSAVLLDEHRHPRPDGHRDWFDEPIFDYVQERPITLQDVADFLSKSAMLSSLPEEETATVATVDTVPWNGLPAFLARLNELSEWNGVQRILLSTSDAGHAFVLAAAFMQTEDEAMPDWHILHGPSQGQTLETFFSMQMLFDSGEAPLETVDMLVLHGPYNAAENQAGMAEQVKRWSTARMQWMIDSIQHGAQRRAHSVDIAALRTKMFNAQGQALVLRHGEYLINDGAESILIRCAGNGNGRAPFYQACQTHPLSCGANAVSAALVDRLDLDAEPPAMTLPGYLPEAARVASDFQGSHMPDLPLNHPDVAMVVLERMHAAVKPVTLQLLHYLTGNLLMEDDRLLPAAGSAQIVRYLGLLKVPHLVIPFADNGLWIDHADWPFLAAMIDGTANALSRMILCYTTEESVTGHFVTIRHDATTRKSSGIDGLSSEQPEQRTSTYLQHIIE